MEKEISDFFKTFPYKTKNIADLYRIAYHQNISLHIDIHDLEVSFCFYPLDFNMKKEIADILSLTINNNFKLNKMEKYDIDEEYKLLNFRFLINKIEDLNEVINILDQFLLIVKLSS